MVAGVLGLPGSLCLGRQSPVVRKALISWADLMSLKCSMDSISNQWFGALCGTPDFLLEPTSYGVA